MRHEEMTRIRRELGLDLAEAGRKAGLVASLQPPKRMKSDAGDCEVDESLGHVLHGLRKNQYIA